MDVTVYSANSRDVEDNCAYMLHDSIKCAMITLRFLRCPGVSPGPSADSQSALVLARGEPYPCVQSEANFLASALATPGRWETE